MIRFRNPSSTSVCVMYMVSISSIVMVAIFIACKIANYGDRKEVAYLTIRIHTQVNVYVSFSFRSFVTANNRSVFVVLLG